VARIVHAQQFLCVDADMLMLGDLRPLFAALKACADGSILACREGNHLGFRWLARALSEMYAAAPSDLLACCRPQRTRQTIRWWSTMGSSLGRPSAPSPPSPFGGPSPIEA
jgi:hypothetical protein